MCLSSLAARHSLFSDPAPPRLTQPLSSRLFLAGDDVEDDEGGGGGDDEGGGGGGVDMRGLLIPVESLTNPPTIYLPTKSSISTY